jgi:glycosyltransferase involved in cell wall biosynthesis
MKILQVTNFFKPSWESGGPARVVYEISKQLVQRGHEVTVYTTDGFKSRVNCEKNKPVDVDGIKTYYFRNLSLSTASINLPIPYHMPAVVRKEISRFDIIHIHEYRTITGSIVWHYAKKCNIPVLLQAHGSLVSTDGKVLFKKSYDTFYGSNLLKSIKKCIALNETEKQQYIQMGVCKENIEIIPNGINLLEYETLPERGIFRKKYGIKDDEKIVLYVGRIHKSKGIDLLINSFSNVVDNLGSSKLILVGPDDGYKKELEHLVKSLNIDSDVLFTGFVSPEERIQAFVDADVFVTPNFSGFPITFVEACACGLPIITSDEGDKLDWIHNQVGYVTNYDVDFLRKAIDKIIKNNDIRNLFSKNCKNAVREKFNWDKITNKIEFIYNDFSK